MKNLYCCIATLFGFYFIMPYSYAEILNENEARKILGRPFYIGEIIPQPQKVEYKNTYISLLDWQKKKLNSCIVIGKEANEAERKAADDLAKRINRLLPENNKLKILTDTEDISSYPVLIAIGTPNTNTLVKKLCEENNLKLSSEYPGKEGYILRLIKNGQQNIILCGGSDARGSYYSVQSFSQMLNIRGTELAWHEVSVYDYPDFACRMASDQYMINADILNFLGSYKMNAVSVECNGWWQDLTPVVKENLKESMALVKKSDLCNIQIRICPQKPRCSKDKTTLRPSRDRDIDALRGTIHFLVENGVSSIWLMQDDELPADSKTGEYLLYPEDNGHFKNLAEAQIYLVNQVAEQIRATNPKCRMVYTPPYYSCQHLGLKPGVHMDDVNNSLPGPGETFLREIGRGLSPEIEIEWNGPEVESSNGVKKDDITYPAKLTGHQIFYGDYSFKRLQPFTPKFPDNFRELVTAVYWGGVLSCPFLRLCYISSTDYAWNTKGYNAEKSFRNSIGSYFGPGMYEILVSNKKFLDDIEKTLGTQDPDIRDDSPLKNKRRLLILGMKNNLEKAKVILKENMGEKSPGYKEIIKALEWSYEFTSGRVEAIAQAKTLKCPKIEVSAPLDGTLQEKFWTKAAKTSNFLEYRSGKEVKEDTYALVAYDDKNLYIGFFCKANFWIPEEKLSKQHDHLVLAEEDIAEIFLDPGRKHNNVLHFMMNSIGTVYDEECNLLGAAWNPVYKIATHKEKDYWTLEIAIPFTSLNINTPRKGEIWGVNFCREYQTAREISSWSWTSKQGFHVPAAFGHLVFE